MNEWLSMIPVSGECSAATQLRAGALGQKPTCAPTKRHVRFTSKADQ
jgi:hypothetical protein